MVQHKVKGSELVSRIVHKPKKLIIALLIGNNIANIGASAMGAEFILHVLAEFHIQNFALSMVLVTVIMTFILLTFGEITPKSLAIKNPERVALFLAQPVFLTLTIFDPFVVFFSFLSKAVSRLLGQTDDMGRMLTAEEIKMMIQLAEEDGVLETKEKQMLHSVFDFSEKIVREVLTPRTDAFCIRVDRSVQDAIAMIVEKGHSRIPVFEDRIDNIVGIIYAKDLLSVPRDRQDLSLRKFLREAVFIPESQPIEALLHQMKKSK